MTKEEELRLEVRALQALGNEAAESMRRLRAQLDAARQQNQRIKRDWRMCSVCSFVWCDPEGERIDCPRCAFGAESDRLRALNAELGNALDGLIRDFVAATPSSEPIDCNRYPGYQPALLAFSKWKQAAGIVTES